MKVIVNQQDFLKALSFAGRALKGKSSIPAFGMFAISVKNNVAHIRVVNDELGIYTQCPIIDGDEVKIAVMGTDLLRVIKPLYGEITLDIDQSNQRVTIKSKTGKYKLPLENYDDMPDQDIKGADPLFSTTAEELNSALSVCEKVVSPDELRPVMGTVNINVENGKRHVVGTDSHQLNLVQNFNADVSEETNVLVTLSAAQALKGLQDQIDVKRKNNFIIYDNGKQKVVQTQIVGNYPKYENVIPQDNKITVTFEKDDLIGAISRIMTVVNSTTHLVALNISEGQINITGQDIDFGRSGEESIACESNGNIEIGFNAVLLSNILKTRKSETLTFQLSNPSRAGLIYGDDDVLSLLMPLMMNV